MKKNTAGRFREMKKNGEKISMLTAYDYSTAKLMDGSGINGVLVGDSMGNVMLGYEDTIPVTMDNMITYGASVARACKNAMVVIDMPFMSYQVSPGQALENAGRLMKETGCNAVKLEGGASVAPQIKAITEAGIPVMGHIGMTPQSVNAFGGFKVQGKNYEAAQSIVRDAMAIQKAGAFSFVVECVPKDLASYISRISDVPVIGIGAGNGTDGQILVYQDMLGLFCDYVPKFVKQYACLGDSMKKAFAAYDSEVKGSTFPDEEHSYSMDREIINKIKEKGINDYC